MLLQLQFEVLVAFTEDELLKALYARLQRMFAVFTIAAAAFVTAPVTVVAVVVVVEFVTDPAVVELVLVPVPVLALVLVSDEPPPQPVNDTALLSKVVRRKAPVGK